MKLENQVVSLPLAQKMKELGFKQESLFWWHGGLQIPYLVQRQNGSLTISAYTVAELGEMLPDGISTSKNIQGMYEVYDNETYKPVVMDFVAKAPTEADARAKMLIYLKENNLLTV